ncbi:hypothetical protein RBH29_15815 [Herbivorax sp. ANBcel31]|uniref:hypothetical protein n=1 Tax=Herbivorax sp. ANBcel31 TaxID=3069754 RepID=UPI0027AECBB4|nr:hypothetical protein [Herbivorax sp. ANBcel31]MDQ2087898.1 hypothetical protein [Herbivorax sp. ANBcel31]
MKLPNGIAGFFSSETNEPLSVDGKQFKQLCYHIAIHNEGKVIDFNEPKYPRKFYYAQVEILGEQFYILLNGHHPYIAFSSSIGFGNIKFIDKPFISEQFSLFYKVLGLADLHVSVDENLIKKTELNIAELEQLAYWKPETVGQIIFNYWD